MLATFLIEIILAFYALWRYKLTTITRLAVVILFSLAAFQIAEYMICGGLGISNTNWARAGYVSITLLPALGIHMIIAISGKKMPMLVAAAYVTCIAFVAYYLFNLDAITNQTCYSNYAVFHADRFGAQLYAGYYYGWLMVGTYFAWHLGMQNPEKRAALHAMMIGYLVFILPTTFFNIIDPNTISGIPSIMCGFAVLLAVVISAKVLPSIPSIQKHTK